MLESRQGLYVIDTDDYFFFFLFVFLFSEFVLPSYIVLVLYFAFLASNFSFQVIKILIL